MTVSFAVSVSTSPSRIHAGCERKKRCSHASCRSNASGQPFADCEPAPISRRSAPMVTGAPYVLQPAFHRRIRRSSRCSNTSLISVPGSSGRSRPWPSIEVDVNVSPHHSNARVLSSRVDSAGLRAADRHQQRRETLYTKDRFPFTPTSRPAAHTFCWTPDASRPFPRDDHEEVRSDLVKRRRAPVMGKYRRTLARASVTFDDDARDAVALGRRDHPRQRRTRVRSRRAMDRSGPHHPCG